MLVFTSSIYPANEVGERIYALIDLVKVPVNHRKEATTTKYELAEKAWNQSKSILKAVTEESTNSS